LNSAGFRPSARFLNICRAPAQFGKLPPKANIFLRQLPCSVLLSNTL
jgi:hypothetical protein